MNRGASNENYNLEISKNLASSRGILPTLPIPLKILKARLGMVRSGMQFYILIISVKFNCLISATFQFTKSKNWWKETLHSLLKSTILLIMGSPSGWKQRTVLPLCILAQRQYLWKHFTNCILNTSLLQPVHKISVNIPSSHQKNKCHQFGMFL